MTPVEFVAAHSFLAPSATAAVVIGGMALWAWFRWERRQEAREVVERKRTRPADLARAELDARREAREAERRPVTVRHDCRVEGADGASPRAVCVCGWASPPMVDLDLALDARHDHLSGGES